MLLPAGEALPNPLTSALGVPRGETSRRGIGFAPYGPVADMNVQAAVDSGLPRDLVGPDAAVAVRRKDVDVIVTVDCMVAHLAGALG